VVTVEHDLYDIAHRAEVVAGTLAVRGREPGREIQRIAFAKRHIELFAEPLDHRPARDGAARLDEAQVARRDAAGARQVELGEAPSDPPLTNQACPRFLAT